MGQRINQKENKNIYQNTWKRKHKILKPMGCCKNSSERKDYSDSCTLSKQKSQYKTPKFIP